MILPNCEKKNFQKISISLGDTVIFVRQQPIFFSLEHPKASLVYPSIIAHDLQVFSLQEYTDNKAFKLTGIYKKKVTLVSSFFIYLFIYLFICTGNAGRVCYSNNNKKIIMLDVHYWKT